MGAWRVCEISDLPKTAGVYAIYMNGALAYVGSTLNFDRRIDQHQVNYSWGGGGYTTKWGFCPVVTIKIRPSRRLGDWLMLEYRLLKRLRPPKNRHLPKRTRVVA